MADQIVVADSPVIPDGAVPPHAVLFPRELAKYKDNVQPTAWEAGTAGQKTLSVYLDDGKSGTTRPILIQFKGYSHFGLDVFKGKTSKKGFQEDDEEKKETNNKAKPGLITFEMNKSPDVQFLDPVVNEIVKRIMKKHLKSLKKLVAPGEKESDVKDVCRTFAKAASGRVKKGAKVSCYPGGCEFRDKGDKIVSFNNFAKSYKGDYKIVVEWVGITATYKDSVLSYGPQFIGKKLVIDEKVQRPALEWREEEEQTVDVVKKEEEQTTKKRKLEEE